MSLAAAFFLGSTSSAQPKTRSGSGRDARVDDAREETLTDLVDHEIERLGSASLRFQPDLEARYCADLLACRRAQVRSLLLVFLLAQAAILFVQSLSEGFAHLSHLRQILILAPWILVVRYAVKRAKSAHVVNIMLAGGVLAVLILSGVSSLGFLDDAPRSGVLHVSLHLVIILAACSLLRLPQRFARALLTCGFTVSVLVFMEADLSVEDRVLATIEVLFVALAALAANTFMERADRESYLMRLRAALQLERTEIDKAAFERIAQVDPLTGVANRRLFDMTLEAAVQKASADEPFLLALIDVDHFKSFNDIEGHLAGDECLRRVAAALRAHAGTGLVARYGGEEFGVLLPGLALDAMAEALDRLRRGVASLSLKHPGRRDGCDTLTVSIGAAVATGGIGARSLIDRADAALYRAKHAGRNRIEVDLSDAAAFAPVDTSELRRISQIAASSAMRPLDPDGAILAADEAASAFGR